MTFSQLSSHVNADLTSSLLDDISFFIIRGVCTARVVFIPQRLLQVVPAYIAAVNVNGTRLEHRQLKERQSQADTIHFP